MHSSIFLLLFALTASLFTTPLKAAGSTVLIVGDSLSAAHNIAIEHSWPVLFERQLKSAQANFNIINASISGESSGGGAERLPALLERHQPDFLIIELGGNDGLRGYKFSLTQEYLSTMIETALRRDIQVMMIGVRMPPNLGPAYNRRFQAVFETLAQQYPIHYLPRFLEGIAANDPAYMQADGIHPTALAQPLLAQRVFEAFRSAFLQ